MLKRVANQHRQHWARADGHVAIACDNAAAMRRFVLYTGRHPACYKKHNAISSHVNVASYRCLAVAKVSRGAQVAARLVAAWLGGWQV